MDPVSAIGVAAAALQFLDASVKAYSAFQQIRSSVTSATKQNEQLEQNINDANKLRAQLWPAPQSQNSPDDPVLRVTDRCVSKANELMALLKYVRGLNEDASSVRLFWRAFWKRKDIQELYAALEEDQKTLHRMMTEKLL
ncbi:hypothetical protein F5Y17DRAFT_324662 [Xylariaceae sp. FL0594]|nr:hypothetical protein F5Y17DRAFT_324662 [Xylariaceae sp. FL0594]